MTETSEYVLFEYLEFNLRFMWFIFQNISGFLVH